MSLLTCCSHLAIQTRTYVCRIVSLAKHSCGLAFSGVSGPMNEPYAFACGRVVCRLDTPRHTARPSSCALNFLLHHRKQHAPHEGIPSMRRGFKCFPASCPSLCSDLNHLKVFLASAAFGTRPVDWNVFPTRAGRYAFLRQTRFFVVNPATNQAHPASVFHAYVASGNRLNECMMVPVWRRDA